MDWILPVQSPVHTSHSHQGQRLGPPQNPWVHSGAPCSFGNPTWECYLGQEAPYSIGAGSPYPEDGVKHTSHKDVMPCYGPKSMETFRDSKLLQGLQQSLRLPEKGDLERSEQNWTTPENLNQPDLSWGSATPRSLVLYLYFPNGVKASGLREPTSWASVWCQRKCLTCKQNNRIWIFFFPTYQLSDLDKALASLNFCFPICNISRFFFFSFKKML